MNTKYTRKYEMLKRVREFGKAHADRFPDHSEGGRAFASVAAAVAQLAGYDDARAKSSERGKQAKAAAREALAGHLGTIARTARVIGRKTPGFEERFKRPTARASDEAILGAGRVFADEAGPAKDRFIAHGMAETFVADLGAMVTALDEAIKSRDAGKAQRAVARKGVLAALASGLAAAQALDVIVTNQLRHDADAIAAWEHGRRVVQSRRSFTAADSAAEVPPPAALPPASPPIPASDATGTLPRSA